MQLEEVFVSVLSMRDFEQFEHVDTGSGLLIWHIPINGSLCVLMGGSGTGTAPMYIRLVKLSENGEMTDEHLDLLNQNADVQGFVNNPVVSQGLTWSFNPYVSAFFPALPD